ncbi:hypothetical protein DID88_004682 [Monilinia fructigena]|uniref:Uracil catabolism protein 4 n=1 Tax=Monilinia fructigena TaxID=38457 RepID=A0A395IRB5_9HELO|nr:hypothetical protein DID88_004682 [Monilinia fructigena]
MGLFSRKEKTSPSNRSSSRTNSTQLTEVQSFRSSQSSLKSPSTPSFSRMSIPTIPKIALPKAPDPNVDPAGYLRSIGSVRERCNIVLEKAKKNDLTHFEVDMGRFKDTTKFVVSIIKRDFAPDYTAILLMVAGNISTDVDPSERTRRILDLFLVSVLLDAGAGTSWKYKSVENGRTYRRSEGLAVASLEMFKAGTFSSNPEQPHQVDADGLSRLTVEIMSSGLQVTEQNPIAGLAGRTGLLVKLAKALRNPSLFGADSRPGNMLDFLISHPSTQAASVPIVPLPTLWSVLIDGLAPIWPASRTEVDGTSIGDAWRLTTMPADAATPTWETIVPFHKLSQWLCYSLMQPMTKLMNIHFAGAELLTGLPEYRNGGLFIDTGVLTLRREETKRGLEAFHRNAEREGKPSLEVVPMFTPDDDVIVEWRAVTVGFLDLLLEEVNNSLGLFGQERLVLPQMLEAGSWKGGREMAEISRPNTQCPPIAILSDGTVF